MTQLKEDGRIDGEKAEPKQVDWTPLAGATRVCLNCDGLSHIIPGLGRGRCPFCHGIGRVYFFSEETRVRVACPGEFDEDGEPNCKGGTAYFRNRDTWDSPHSCTVCQGRGWVANRDGWIWWRVLESIDGWARITVMHQGYRTRFQAEVLLEGMLEIVSVWENDPEAAFKCALEQGVGSSGGTLGEGSDDHS